MTDHNGKPIADAVLHAIKGGEVRMQPRWHFVLRSALIATGIVTGALALIFVVSLIVFSLRVNGAWFAPSFGLRGLRTLLMALPWVLILTALLFVALLETAVQRYAFAYRRPLLYSALGIIGLAAAGGFGVATTPFHEGMRRYAFDRRIPMAGPLYRQYGQPHLANVHPGVVLLRTEDGFRLQDRDRAVLRVLVTPETRFVPGPGVEEGDFVVVFGDLDGDALRAVGVRRFEMPPTDMRDEPTYR